MPLVELAWDYADSCMSVVDTAQHSTAQQIRVLKHRGSYTSVALSCSLLQWAGHVCCSELVCPCCRCSSTYMQSLQALQAECSKLHWLTQGMTMKLITDTLVECEANGAEFMHERLAIMVCQPGGGKSMTVSLALAGKFRTVWVA